MSKPHDMVAALLARQLIDAMDDAGLRELAIEGGLSTESLTRAAAGVAEANTLERAKTLATSLAIVLRLDAEREADGVLTRGIDVGLGTAVELLAWGDDLKVTLYPGSTSLEQVAISDPDDSRSNHESVVVDDAPALEDDEVRVHLRAAQGHIDRARQAADRIAAIRFR